jgi:hypothetical protein
VGALKGANLVDEMVPLSFGPFWIIFARSKTIATTRSFRSSPSVAVCLPISRKALPEPLDFVSDKHLSVSDVSKTLGFGDDQDMQNGSKS